MINRTEQEEKEFLEEAASNRYILFFEHDPVHECCDLQITYRGIRSGKTFLLSEI